MRLSRVCFGFESRVSSVNNTVVAWLGFHNFVAGLVFFGGFF